MNIPLLLNTVNQYMQNPQAILSKMNIPAEHTNSPEDVADYLVKSGRVSQAQIDQAHQMYSQYFKR